MVQQATPVAIVQIGYFPWFAHGCAKTDCRFQVKKDICALYVHWDITCAHHDDDD